MDTSPASTTSTSTTWTTWTVTRHQATAGELHRLEPPAVPSPSVWVNQVTRPALVLGSTQKEDLIDADTAAADGVEVCRRRTGGGLVLLSPGDCWVDLLIPVTSVLWDIDVGRAFAWIGQAWAMTLSEVLDDATIEVHQGPLLGGAAGRLICFAGLGPGEVTVGGRKVVGISQRRWRTGARFQSLVVSRWDPAPVGRYVRADALHQAGIDLYSLPIGLTGPTALPPADTLVESLVSHLPRPASVATAVRRERPIADADVNDW